VGSTELAIVVCRPSWREIFLRKAGDRHKERPWALWATISLAPMVRKNECLRIACESVSGHLLGVPPPLMH